MTTDTDTTDGKSWVTFQLDVRDRQGQEFTFIYDSRTGFNVRGTCWNRDIALVHDMISSCTAFTRNAEA